MKITIPFFCILLLASCSNNFKTYYSNGSTESECPLDLNGKKNGLYKIYNKDGQLDAEVEMTHDTMSGLLKYYYPKSGKVHIVSFFRNGIYDIPLTDSDFVSKINPYTFTEGYIYNELGSLIIYHYLTQLKNNSNLSIFVQYQHDSISIIKGIGLTLSIKHIRGIGDTITNLTVLAIPKCIRNFYVLDSSDNTIDSCIGCKDINVQLDRTKYYSLKTEYIDSTFHIKHSLKQPFINCDRSKYPDGINSLQWERE
jgi:hypothetical protein